MIYILLALQVLAENVESTSSTKPQWFLVKKGSMSELDAEQIVKLDMCFSSYKQKYHNETHCLVEFYNETGCKTLSGKTEYWAGKPIDDVKKYINDYGYYYHIYHDDECKTPFLYVVYTNRNCNYELGLSTYTKYYSWLEPEGNKLKYCTIGKEVEKDKGTCTDEVKEDCGLYDVEKCFNNQLLGINYDKFDSGVDPLRLLLFFGILMLFL